MSDHDAIIRANYAEVTERVAEACRKSGRESDSARLVAVTKYADLSWVESLIALGHRELGESRPQQLVQRSELLPSDVDWHLIGHLQRNKVRAVLPHTGLVHSIDSTRLLERVDRIANEIGLSPQVLLEVNVSGESSKQGYGIDDLLGNGKR